MHDQINSRANTILWLLFAASGLLFVIACSNVANLVLARTVRRESELAVRSALGASTAVLRRSLLAESMVLCGSGAIAAILLAMPMVAVLGRYAARFSRARQRPHARLQPGVVRRRRWRSLPRSSLRIFRGCPRPIRPHGGLTGRGTRVAGGSTRKLRMFAVTQIAASFLLLAGACVLMKTLFMLEQTRPPFDSANVLAVNLPVMSYGKTPQQVSEFYRDVRTVCRAARCGAGVRGLQRALARRAGKNISFTLPRKARTGKTGKDDFRAQLPRLSRRVSLRRWACRILEGRDFNDGDKEGNERVVIISKSLANQLYPGQDAVNRKMWWTDGVIKFIGISPEPRRIIAVVPDFDDENIIPEPAMTIYQPIDQEGLGGRLFVRAHQDAYALVPAITRPFTRCLATSR